MDAYVNNHYEELARPRHRRHIIEHGRKYLKRAVDEMPNSPDKILVFNILCLEEVRDYVSKLNVEARLYQAVIRGYLAVIQAAVGPRELDSVGCAQGAADAED